MKILQYTLSTLFLLSLIACGGGDDSPGELRPPQLVFPENNSECLEGEVSPSDDNVSVITFRWEAVGSASGYTITVKNLLSGVLFVESSTTNSIPVDLQRGTPYSWTVITNGTSMSSSPSETWKFFNAGEGRTSYAPFPADLVSPRSGSTLNINGTGSVELRWQGADVDNDIANYEVLLDTQDPPETSIGGNGPADSFTAENLETGTTYFWRVITTDEAGNSSTSEVSQFTIDN